MTKSLTSPGGPTRVTRRWVGWSCAVAASVLLLVAVVLWQRSARHWHGGQAATANWAFDVQTYPGGVRFGVWSQPARRGVTLESLPYSTGAGGWGAVLPDNGTLGFQWLHRVSANGRRSVLLFVPFWAVTTATAIASATGWLAVYHTRRGFEAGCCMQCGYDLRAGHERCPECGCEVRPASASASANALTPS